MCPKLSNVCEIAGLQQEEIKCADKDCCMSNDWVGYGICPFDLLLGKIGLH